MTGRVTVADLRGWLRGFDDDATVVVQTGIGYEEPRIALRDVRPVAVPQRYLPEREGETVIALVGVHT